MAPRRVKNAAEAFRLRRMGSGDIEQALTLTVAENWPHTLADWLLHFELGEGWVACDPQGTVIGVTLRWDYAEPTSTLGLIVVSRAWRGRGVARELVARALADGDARYFRLAATQDGLKLYLACGFRPLDRIVQHQGVPAGVAPMKVPQGATVRPLAEGDTEALCRLDALAFGADRYKLITALRGIGHGLALERDGRVAGFVLARAGGRGLWLGPLVCESEDDAILLLSQLLAPVEEWARIDVPIGSGQLRAWLESVGLTAVAEAVVMDRGQGQLWRASSARCHGLVSQALG